MHRIESSIEVDVPVTTAYNQWTQFESFPAFMEGVEQVEQVSDRTLHWVASVAGRVKEWDADIIEQVPDEVVSWRSTSGTTNSGSVTFLPLGIDRCKVTCIMTYEPETLTEKVGDALGLLKARVEGDLRRFKGFIEERRVETGAWRGEVRDGKVKKRSHRAGRENIAAGDANPGDAGGAPFGGYDGNRY